MANNKIVDREGLKAFRQANDTRYKNGSVVVGKSLTTKQIENINDEVGSTQTNPFLFQGTGTNDNTTETPTAPVAKHLELRGNSIVWNQLVGSETSSLTLTSGHKYLTKISGVETIITSSGETISVTGGTDQVFDLTLLGKEYDSVLAFKRDYPLPYYSYNAGTLKSCKTSALEDVTQNQFQELNAFIEVIAGTEYYISGISAGGYIEEYDGAKNLIKTSSEITSATTIELSENTHYVKVQATTYADIMLCIYWGVGEDYSYKPYRKYRYTLPEVELRSAGNAYDVIYSSGNGKRRVWLVKLTDLSLSYYVGSETYANTFRATLPTGKNGKYPSGYNVKANLTCNAYKTVSLQGNEYQGGTDKTICLRENTTIQIQDSQYNGDLQAFLNANANTYIQYELETEEDITSYPFAENIDVDDMGTMKFVPSADNLEPIIPQGNKFFYPADYVLFIDDMYNRSKDGGETSSANNFVTQSELQQAVGNIDVSTLVNPTIKSNESSTHGLVSPNTTSWTADKEIATTDELSFPLINAPTSTTLTDEQITQIISKGAIIVGNISGWGNWQKYILFPCGEQYSGRYFGYCILTRNGYSHVEQYSINLVNKTIGSYGDKYIDIDSSRNISIVGLNSVNNISINQFYKKPQSSVSLSDGGTITNSTLKSLIQNEQPIKLNGFTCYFSCDDGTNYQYVSTRYDSSANKNHINVITINKSTWVATFHTSDIAV